jgi:archaellum biogenesis ATPase FlaH
MPEKFQVNDRFMRMHPEYFQKTVLLVAIKSYQFYRHVRGKLCPMEEARKSRRPDFQGYEYNKIFGLVVDYWDHVEPQLLQTHEYSMRYCDLEELLRSEIEHVRMTQPDAAALGKLMEEDMELFAYAPDVLSRLQHNPMLNKWLEKRTATNLIEFAYSQRIIKPLTLDDLSRLASAALASVTGETNRVIRGADLIFGNTTSSLPFPTDLDGVNEATGGGLRPRTTTLVAGINGGGKTILAMQWAKHYALNGANAVVFTTEQPPEQLIIRMICNHLQVGFGRFTRANTDPSLSFAERRNQNVTSSIIPEDVMDEFRPKIEEFYHMIYPHLFFVDWSTSPMAVYKDFDTEMDRITATGWDPDVVILDWIGGGIDNVRGSGSGAALDIRLLYKEAIETIISHGKRTRRVMIAMAQLNKTNVGPKKKAVVMADLAECKSMTDNVSQFVGISSLRSTLVTDTSARQINQFLNLDKARFGPGGLVPVEATFRLQSFRDAGKSKHL